jgi:UDP:flavonoid glycosyltransferase YjiC (YdhE family)
MRVLFMTAAGLGHIHPVIPLARAAAAAGDEVLFAVPAEAVAKIEAFGFAATAVPFGDPADIGRAWANLPDHDLNSYVVADIFLRIHGRAALAALQDLIAGFRADLLVSAEMGALVAAEASGIDRGMLGITALDVADLDLDRVIAALDDLRESAGLARSGRMPYDSGSRYLSAVPPLLWADPAHQPSKAIWFRHEDAEGPVRSAAHSVRPRPQVYATLGSVAGENDFGRPIFRLVLAALGRLDADALFTVGPFDRAQLGSVPANVTIAAYAPQAEAMDCDVVVTHAGSGTTVAALTRGLPLVAVPMFADQMHNADRLVAAGVGVRVDPDQVSEGLTVAIERVLRDTDYRMNAAHIAADIAARPSPAEALDLLRT